MNCFNDYIGLRGVCDGNSVSVYLEQCGITADMLNKFNYTHDDVKSLLLDQLDQSSDFVSRQIKMLQAGEVLAADVLVNARVGHPERNRAVVAAKTGFDAGLLVELEKDTDYVQINVDSISLFLDFTGSVDVLVYDLTEARLVDTISCSATAGQMTYTDVNKVYRAQARNMALAFLYDSTTSSYKTTALANQKCGSCSSKKLKQSHYTSVSGVKFADGDDKTISNTKYESDTAGLSVTYTVRCDYNQWICKNQSVLLTSVLYYTAYNIARYGLNSPRLNSETLDMRTTLEAIRDNAESNYNNEINSVVGVMTIPQNDCFKCNQKSRSITTL